MKRGQNKKEKMLKMDTFMTKFKGEKYSFDVCFKNLIGKGGNGCVYKVDNLTPKIDTDDIKFYAVKFFKYKKNEDEQYELSQNDKYIRRYTRFKKEIKKIYELQELQGADGIVEIIDYSLPEELPSEYKKAWFLMPGLEKFPKPGTIDLFQIIEYMLQLAQILKLLHENDKKIAHRDIKRSNLLLRNNKVYLADFGLIWIEDEESFTLDEERIGPKDIMPPEFKEMNHSINIPLDYTKSDVYLYAKVLWMYLKKTDHGFQGEYNRTQERYYINPDSFNVITLGPIQDLIEQATFESMDKRIDINQCIKNLQLQKKILNNEISKRDLNQIIFKEIILSFFEINKRSDSTFTNTNEIFNILEKIQDITALTIKNIRKDNSDILIKEYTINKSERDLFRFESIFSGKEIYFESNIEQILYIKNANIIKAKLKYINTLEAKLNEFSEEKYNTILYENHVLIGKNKLNKDDKNTIENNTTVYTVQENFELLFSCK